jgi:YVTN family beta-propeller protein
LPFSGGPQPTGIATDPAGSFVFVVDYGDGSLFSDPVNTFTITSDTGALTFASAAPFATGTNAKGIAIDPTGKYAYIANSGSNTVSAYTIDATTGAFTAVSGSPFAAGTTPFGVAVDPTGKFLYVSNQGSNNVSAYTIGSGGVPTAVSGSPFATGTTPYSVAVDPTGKYLCVSNFGSDNISVYAISSSTGTLTEVSGSPFGARTALGIAITAITSQ